MSRRSAVPALALIVIAACSYDAHFGDCTVSCDPNGEACPDGLSCGTEGLCRAPGTTTCSTILGDAGGDARGDGQQFLSCDGLAATCGPSGNDSCCDTAMPIPGGTYYRSYDVASDAMFSDMSFPATVSSFVLDKYEVTLGRFRAFVNTGMGTQANPPPAGAGAHPNIPNSGWDSSWDSSLTPNTATLIANLSPWQATPGASDNLPIGNVTWFEAMAFCAWDGGYLPTEAEWNFVAAGGDEQRAYPWSIPSGSTTIDCTLTNYGGSSSPSTACHGSMTTAVGEDSQGDGRWGQSDLGGNALEWTLDWFAPYSTTCNDCANLVPGSARVLRGGDCADVALSLRNGFRRGDVPPSMRFGGVGFRCAR